MFDELEKLMITFFALQKTLALKTAQWLIAHVEQPVRRYLAAPKHVTPGDVEREQWQHERQYPND